MRALNLAESTRKKRPSLQHPAAKSVLFVLCLLPLAWLIYGAFADTLGSNPAEKLIRATGDWTFRFLCLTLTITPLRRWAQLPALLRFRRMIGMFTFFYACMHFLCYGWLDMGLVLDDIVRDIIKRPFILVGASALLLMTPLALTSFNRAIRIMGARRWQSLHRTIYVIGLLGLLHFFWMRSAKNNYNEVIVYAGVIFVLLGYRFVESCKAYSSQRALDRDQILGKSHNYFD